MNKTSTPKILCCACGSASIQVRPVKRKHRMGRQWVPYVLECRVCQGFAEVLVAGDHRTLEGFIVMGGFRHIDSIPRV